MQTEVAWDSSIKTHVTVVFWMFTDKTKLQYIKQTLTLTEASLLHLQLQALLYQSEIVTVIETSITE